MTTITRLAVLLSALVLAACATPYQETGFLNWEAGGYRVIQVVDQMRKPIEGRWRVIFEGNQNTTLDTVQTYGLYRCAEFALEKGFDGFEVIPQARMSSAPADPRVQPVQFIFIPSYVRIPVFRIDIHLIKKPFVANPPGVFDARVLKAALEPHVMGEKCDGGNICPHSPDYLLPTPPAEPQAPPV